MQVYVQDHTNTTIYDHSNVKHDTFTFLTIPGHFSFCFVCYNYLYIGNTAYYMRIEQTEIRHE